MVVKKNSSERPLKISVKRVQIPHDNLLLIELALGFAAAELPHFQKRSGVGAAEKRHGLRQRVHVVRRNQQAVLPVFNGIAAALPIRRDERLAAGQRFEQAARHAFMIRRRQRDDIGLTQKRQHVVGRWKIGEDAAGVTRLNPLEQGARIGAARVGNAENPAARVRQAFGGLQKEIVPLFRQQPPEHQERARRSGLIIGRRRERRHVHAGAGQPFGAFRQNQAMIEKCRQVFAVLEKHGMRAGKGDFVQAAREARQKRLPVK